MRVTRLGVKWGNQGKAFCLHVHDAVSRPRGFSFMILHPRVFLSHSLSITIDFMVVSMLRTQRWTHAHNVFTRVLSLHKLQRPVTGLLALYHRKFFFIGSGPDWPQEISKYNT